MNSVEGGSDREADTRVMIYDGRAEHRALIPDCMIGTQCQIWFSNA